MVRKWGVRLFAVGFLFALVLLAAGGPRAFVRAESLIPRAYFPVIFRGEPTRFDDFSDQDPEWQYKFKWRDTDDDDKGTFSHRDGLFYAQIVDNSTYMVAWPGWRPQGDFKLEADMRFEEQSFWWQNGVGLVFGGSDDWQEHYSFMLGFNFKQHNWSFSRVDPIEQHYYYTGWGGAPPDVRWWYEWNRLMVVRIGDTIQVYANGVQLPGGSYDDGKYGTNRLVGLVASAFEGIGDAWFDNFKLTPLSSPY